MAKWKIVPYPETITLQQVSYGSEAHIWGVTIDGEIYKYSEGSWSRIQAPLAGTFPKKCQWISVAIGGAVWCTTLDDSIFRKTGIDTWTLVAGKLNQLSVAPGVVWGVTGAPNNDTYKLTQAGTWAKQAQDLKCVSVGSDGKVWGIAPNGNIRRLDQGTWKTIPGSLEQIAVGSASEVWGINASGAIYKYSGNDSDPWIQISGVLYKYSDGGWTEETAELEQISVGSDGTVWGIAKNPDPNLDRKLVICNYYLKDSHLLVSAPKIDEVRLEQGDWAMYKFTVSNISSGAKLTEIDLELIYDDFGPNIKIVTQEGDENADPPIPDNPSQFERIPELKAGESKELTFKIEALEDANFKTYWFNCIEARYLIEPDKQPALPPVTGGIKGFMSFEVVED
jgi:hypothetical protein